MTDKKHEPDQNSLPEATETVTEDTSLPEETSTDHPEGDDK